MSFRVSSVHRRALVRGSAQPSRCLVFTFPGQHVSIPPYAAHTNPGGGRGGGGSGRWRRRNGKFLEEAELLGQPSARRMGSVIMVTSGGVRITACTRRGGEGGAGGRRADTNQRRPCTQPRSASARNFRKPGLLSVFVGLRRTRTEVLEPTNRITDAHVEFNQQPAAPLT